jgi:hypothetical protein
MNHKWFSLTIPACAFLFAFLMPSVSLAQSKARTATATELWVRGDDGLTQRFAGALKLAIADSIDFNTSTAKSKEKMLLYIPDHIYWCEAQGRTNFQYVVIFTNQDSKYLGVSIGACWEEDISECAQTVLTDARYAWRHRLDLPKH